MAICRFRDKFCLTFQMYNDVRTLKLNHPKKEAGHE